MFVVHATDGYLNSPYSSVLGNWYRRQLLTNRNPTRLRKFFFFQTEDGIRVAQESRWLGDVYKGKRPHRVLPALSSLPCPPPLASPCLLNPSEPSEEKRGEDNAAALQSKKKIWTPPMDDSNTTSLQ